jgi:hypothetical protein
MDLIRLASSHSVARAIVKDTLRLRFYSLIRDYFGLDTLIFSELLRQSSGVICGSAAIWMFKTPCTWSPNDINIFVPYQNTQLLSLFFESRGYKPVRSRIVGPDYGLFRQHINTVHIFIKSDMHKRITVTESCSPSVFPLLLQPFDTLFATFVTADGLVCLYPHQLFTNVRICGSRSQSGCQLDKAYRLGFRSEMSTADWDGECGTCCPVLIRRICGLRGVARLDWAYGSVSGEDNILKFTAGNHFKWRLGDICLNKNCPFYFKG